MKTIDKPIDRVMSAYSKTRQLTEDETSRVRIRAF